MSDPVINSFFIGRALAQAMNDKLSEAVTVGLSELGKFDAEQRVKLQSFTQEVMARAARETGSNFGNSNSAGGGTDLQETIDDLRAEIARLRAELQRYRNRTQS
jgi:uncharacterized small protein (DUF1192 family)